MARLGRLMVPFLCAMLLLSTGLMVPLPARADESQISRIAAYEPEQISPEEAWAMFWAKLRNHAKWDLEYYDGARWVSVKSDLSIVREYPELNRMKFTLVFDASHAANYRLTFAIDQAMRGYVTRVDQYAYDLTYDNMSLTFDWSDAAAVPSIVFSHGVQDGYFWFRMRRDNVPLGAHVEIDPQVIADYAFTNLDGWLSASDHHPSDTTAQSAWAMSFQTPATDQIIYAVDFKMAKVGAPTGLATAQVYAHAGVFGVSSVPSGAALATSDTFQVSTISGTPTIRFFFTGANQITLTNLTYYCVAYVNPGAGTIDGSNYPMVGSDSTPGAAGNAARYRSGAWGAYTTRDVGFVLWGMGAPTIVDVTPTPSFSQGVPGWVNVTVQEDLGVANLNRVDLWCNSTSGQNFTLRWTQATDTFSEVDDPDGICFPDVTGGSISVNLNATSVMVCYLFTLSDATTEGDLEATVTVLNDDALTDTGNYPALFAYVGIAWNDMADLINSLFSVFGILDYMDSITDYIDGLKAYLIESLTSIVTLVVQQFVFITLVFGSFIYWFTELLGILVDFVVFVQEIFDGVSAWYNVLGSWWDYVGWNNWAPAIPLFLFIWWISSIEKRADVTPGGEIQVFVNDFNTAANVLGWFLGVFSFVANTVIDRVYGLIQAIV